MGGIGEREVEALQVGSGDLDVRQIRLRQFGIRAALLHIGLCPRQIRRLCLRVSDLRSRQVRLCAQQLRIRARISARHVFPRTWHVHACRSGFTLRQPQ